MTKEDVVEAVRAAIAEDRKEFWVPGEQHYLDHEMLKSCREAKSEWIENHRFISNVRHGISIGEKAGITVIVVSLLSFVGGAIWLSIKHYLAK